MIFDQFFNKSVNLYRLRMYSTCEPYQKKKNRDFEEGEFIFSLNKVVAIELIFAI
jgi:hypothetical protein